MISTPTFGSCILSGVHRCALSSNLCTPSETYRPARATTQCNSPNDLETGRCTGTTDDFRCAATREACYFPLSFDDSGGTGNKEPPDDKVLTTCNLQYGEGDDGYSLFPLCRGKPSTGEILRCVLFKEECSLPTEDLVSATWALDWKTYDSCKCHDVPVGVCHIPDLAMDKITSGNSYCAVGAWDCQDDHTAFVSGVEALSLPNMQCRLCHNTELKSGACVNPLTSNIQKCALERSACPEDTTFMSSRQLESSGQATSMQEATCPSALHVALGECTSPNDDVECAAHGDACWYRFRFEERSECNLIGNDQTMTPTYYGTCGGKPGQDGYDYRNFRCVWGEDDCHATLEVYRAARIPMSWFPGCTCEKVKTGACIDDEGGVPYCAVSAGSCSSESATFITAREFSENGLESLDCRLCRDRSSYVTALSVDKGTSKPTSNPTSKPINNPSIPSKSSPAHVPVTNEDVPSPPAKEPLPADSVIETFVEELIDEPKETISLVGLILGSAVAVFFLMLGVAVVYKRMKRSNDTGISTVTFQGHSKRQVYLGDDESGRSVS